MIRQEPSRKTRRMKDRDQIEFERSISDLCIIRVLLSG
jgi:hypothetical protein